MTHPALHRPVDPPPEAPGRAARCRPGNARGGARRATGAGLALAVAAALAGCDRGRDATKSPPPIRPVKTMVIAASDGLSSRSFSGRVDATKRVELAFQVPGLLVELPIAEGQRIAKGDLIARLREDEFRARLATLQGQLDQARAVLVALRAGERVEERARREAQVRAAEARLATARADFTRFSDLVAQNAAARADYERAEAAFRVAEQDYKAAIQLVEKGTVAREEDIAAQDAAVRSLEGRVAEAAVNLQDCTLRAPYDGVISEIFVQVNQSIRATEPVVRYQNVDEIDVAVDMPESVMAWGIRGPDVESMEASFSSVPGRTFPVRISEVSQFADPVTQTFRVRFGMPAPKDVTILPGMTGFVRITRRGDGTEASIRVPTPAVVNRAGGESVVWIVGEDGSVRARPVVLGPMLGSEIAIAGGLSPGERIAVAGASALRDGMKVRDLGDALGSRRP